MALEACDAAAMVRRVGKQNPPMRQVHAPKPDCRLGEDFTAAALFLIDVMRETHRRYTAATYLFVDEAGNAYAIGEDRSVALQWVREHLPWFVGRYQPVGRQARAEAKLRRLPVMELTLDGLVEDLADHMRQLGVGR